ncbi:MAG TPA: hypothetical protein ENH99_02960 [Candidatus Pacearchaeota archaeon]|nr:hypothetical protein [Candidatus Pacearchaeota archaeon]
MIKKAQLQVSFAWLFAIIVGAFILFIAIYGVTRLSDTGGELTSAKTGKEIGILLNPLETGFEDGITTLLTMPVETRINNGCLAGGNFGRQTISVSQLSFGEFKETEIDVGFSNKYIFSDKVIQGENFFIFSKPFNFPFKVSDVIYLTSSDKEYCFVESDGRPERIENEISKLGQDNLLLEDCSENSVRVCFETEQDCDIEVSENRKSVEKRGETLYYETDALMFAAIFSEKNVYECQIQRLVKRTKELSLIYDDKVSLISSRGCATSQVNLLGLIGGLEGIEDSSDLVTVSSLVKSIERENDREECRLW